jgi:hypothetical protein
MANSAAMRIVTDDGGRANLLNDYFSSVCDDDDGNIAAYRPCGT